MLENARRTSLLLPETAEVLGTLSFKFVENGLCDLLK